MDKHLANNQIVLMRKTVRNVKRFVYQKVMKQMKKFEIKSNNLEKTELKEKYENKMLNKKRELIAIKGANVDNVSKEALIHKRSHFEDVIKSNQSSVEEKCLARIAINANIEKMVNKFKDENPNCDQWLPSQIELWYQKKTLKRNKLMKKKSLGNEGEDKSMASVETIDDNLNEKPLESTETESKKSKVMSKSKKDLKTNKDLNKSVKNDSKVDQKIESNEEKTEKRKFDSFFLTNDLYLSEEQLEDNSIDGNERQIERKTDSRKRDFKPKHKNDRNFSKRIEKSHSNNQRNNTFGKNPNIKTKRFENSDRSEQKIKGKTKSTGDSDEVLHPSWAAKRTAKEKFKINLDKPLATKIIFN